MNQADVTGALYLENSLTPHAFTSARVAVLKLIASQAAVSLKNTLLYRDLALREARIRRLVDANIIGICISRPNGDILEANDAFLRIVRYDRAEFLAGRVSWMKFTASESARAHQTRVGGTHKHRRHPALRERVHPQGRQPRPRPCWRRGI